MKIELDANIDGKNIISAYDDDSVTIAGRLHRQSIIISPAAAVEDWAPQSFSAVLEQHFARLITAKPEIILFGTGQRHRFPAYDIASNLAEQHIGLEIMDTRAACRAYNFLVGEGREVLAALLMPNAS